MGLKEIKPEMAVHCKNEKEKKMLLEEAERLGYVWYSTKGKPTERSTHSIGCTIHFYDKGTNSFSVDYKHITHSCQTGDSVIEFSDLIIPEMSAEEVLQIVKKLEFEFVREYLGLPYGKSLNGMLFDAEPRKIIDMCEQWKSDHEKKEPEIEWVFKGVADIVGCNEIEFFVSEEAAREWCERRTLETGNNHAYVPVCRVKVVE